MRIAVAQTPGTRLDQWRDTLTLVGDLVKRARRLGAQLVVLPECVWPAYHLGSQEAYFAARRAGLPGHDAFCTHLARCAQQVRIAICAGYVEESAQRLYNAACLIAEDGRLLGTHRKCFLWDFDHRWFAPGEAIMPADTAFGRVGLMVCADARLPEIPATLAARGARLILQPTAWVNAGTAKQRWNPQPDFLISARAREFGVPIASASKWGWEGADAQAPSADAAEFIGSSLICDADGHVLAQCAQEETTVVAADVEPGQPRGPRPTARQHAALTGQRAPRTPSAAVAPLDIWLLPASSPGADVGKQVQELAARRGGRSGLILVSPSPPNLPATSVVCHGATLCLAGPASETLEIGGARVAAVGAADAWSFAAIRCLALEGVHLVVIFGDAIPVELVRARACENQVFIVWVRTGSALVIDPRGRVCAEPTPCRGLSDSEAWQLDVRLSADKKVAPDTDVIADRCAALYVC